MSRDPDAAEGRSVRVDRRKPGPRFGFWKGAAAGILVVIPADALAVWAAARLQILDQSASLIACLRMAVVFAGLAATITAGGVGRLAAEAAVDGGRRRAVVVAARAMAAGGAALVLVAAIPLGGLPMSRTGWVLLALVGAGFGAASGATIGVVCSGSLPTLQELVVWPRAGKTPRPPPEATS